MMARPAAWILVLILDGAGASAFGQKNFVLSGKVLDTQGQHLPGAVITVEDHPEWTTASDDDGRYTLSFPHSGPWTISATFVGHQEEALVMTLHRTTSSHLFRLSPGTDLSEAQVIGEGSGEEMIQRIDPRIVSKIPTPRGTIEDALLQAPVNFTSELSSAYNVRGGSFDENLVYVNDIEVYRPFLVRSGQQEGLSFANPDMVERIEFSAGGFEAKYGDKLSSVLDIHYRKPAQSTTRTTASTLGAQIQHDNVWGPVTMNLGLRYRNNRYILSTLDERGEYAPTYIDAQTYLTWDPDGYGPWEIQALGVYGKNDFLFFPDTRETNIGTINQAARLTVYYDGQEQSGYETGFGAVAVERRTETSHIRWIQSIFQTAERESFDVLGAYLLSELERDPGGDTFDEGEAFGVGGFLQHGRNVLFARVLSSTIKGYKLLDEHELEWGVKHRYETFDDEISEWNVVDSAGFFAPHPLDNLGYASPGGRPDQLITLPYFAPEDPERTLRSHPRNGSLTIYKVAGGYYFQPPFYREMRGLAVKSILMLFHNARSTLGGVDHEFTNKGRPFKLVGEMYYKDLTNLIPYEIENVRQRYYATNNSNGYATGLDVMVNGEFIPGIQSWLRMSALKTEEDLTDDSYQEFYNADGLQVVPGYHSGPYAVIADTVTVYPGMIPRPADQRFSLSLLFQDEMPRNPDYKVLLSLYFGSGLPYGPPSSNRYDDVLRTPPYRRVDVGFSRLLYSDDSNKSGLLSLEVFNLLGINNTINHNWIQDVNSRYYAVPNFLTGRRLNLKLTIEF